jgi:hypothetical protein
MRSVAVASEHSGSAEIRDSDPSIAGEAAATADSSATFGSSLG